jgi:gluconolactonase
MAFTEVTDGLLFPEGPVAMPDGTVILTEMFGAGLTRVHPDGRKETFAEIAGGCNGLAVGPGGDFFVANNGARFTHLEVEGMCFPGPTDFSKYIGGRITKVDAKTGAVSDLYTECNGRPLVAPNDLVFDAHGGFYFTDHGMTLQSGREPTLTAPRSRRSSSRRTSRTASGCRRMAPSSTGPRRGPGA